MAWYIPSSANGKWIAIAGTLLALLISFFIVWLNSIDNSNDFLIMEQHDFYVADTVYAGAPATVLVSGFLVNNNKVWENEQTQQEFVNRMVLIHDSLSQSSLLPRLLSQLELLEYRGAKHKNTLVYFSRMSFAFIMMQGFLLLLTVIFGGIISRDGWKAANKYMVGIFIATGGGAAFVHSVPDAMNFEGNMDRNGELYTSHVKATQEVYTYLSTMENLHGKPQSAEDFLHHVDAVVLKLSHVSVSFDKQLMDNAFDAVLKQQAKN